jgi:purine-binding chemotaxis protein CheW
MADLVRSRSRLSLARRGAPVDRGPRTEYLAFRLGEDVYAGPVSLVREILKPPPLTPVPRAPFAVMGIVSVRGQLVTVIDLRRRLRLPEAGPSRRSRVLLVNPLGGEVLGLYVDEVLQVYRLAEEEIELAAAALGGEVAPYISGIARPIVQGTSASGSSHAEASLLILLELSSLLAT